MKRMTSFPAWTALVVLSWSCLVAGGCGKTGSKTYDRLKSYINGIKVVDTHEHQRKPQDISKDFNYLKYLAYFYADLRSAGASDVYGEALRAKDAGDQFAAVSRYYDFSRATSYHAQLMKNYRILYNFTKPYLDKNDLVRIAGEMEKNFRDYDAWFSTNFDKAGFEIMILDQYWAPYNTDIDRKHFGLVFRIDHLISNISDASRNQKITKDPEIFALLGRDEIPMNSLDDYLTMAAAIFAEFKSRNVLCLKDGQAYDRTLDYEDVPEEAARALFRKGGPLVPAEQKKLEDFMFHWIVKEAIELDLPIQIHAGYLAGNSGWIDQGHPLKLLKVFKRYPEARFVVFHGGYPWTGDFVALAKNFPNVYPDIVWLPQISRTAAERTLHELLDCVPFNKICWGGDVWLIDDAVGSLEVGKEVVASVLAERVDKGWLSEDLAREIARRIFRENAIDIYRLDKKLHLTY